MIKLSGKELKFEMFPNGETKFPEIEILNFDIDYLLSVNYESDQDIFNALIVGKHLVEKNIKVNLHILYMPYSRMDRVETDNEIFSLKHVSSLINSVGFGSIVIDEPHSDVCVSLLNNCRANNVSANMAKFYSKEVERINGGEIPVIMFYPDATAAKRYCKQIDAPYAVGIKNRDWKTGQITSFQVAGNLPVKEFDVFIVDDLCSYGGTFIASAKELKKLGARDIYLVVTHCEDNIHLGNLLKDDDIKQVFTTRSILTNIDNKKIVA